MKLYWNEEALLNSEQTPDVLAEGDSWLSHFSWPNGDLLARFARMASDQHTLYSTARVGKEVVKMLRGVSRDRLVANLDGYPKLKMILFSGGGCDLAGSHLAELLRRDCSQAKSFMDCFRPGQPTARLKEIEAAYRTLIALRDTYRPKAVIVSHNYDYAFANGKAMLASGPWFKPYFNEARIKPEFQIQIINYLLDQLGQMLKRLQSERFVFVQTAGTLTDLDWEDELHATREGLDTMAERFHAVFKQYLD